MLEPSYSFSIITSATQQPDELKELLLNELKKYRGQLVDQEAFDLLKTIYRRVYFKFEFT